jgi:hypothetical protein
MRIQIVTSLFLTLLGTTTACHSSGLGDSQAELRGTCILEGGAPAAGAKLSLHGFEANTERVLEFGKPADWKDLSAECDASGNFVLRFDPPRAYQFTLQASAPEHATARWRWGALEPGSTQELGTIELPRSGTITGRLLDAQGHPVSDAWQVYAEAPPIAHGPGGDTTHVNAAVDPATGTYRIEGLPAGKVELKAHSQMANWIPGPTVEVRAGATTEADFRYEGPDNSRCITVIPMTRPFHVFAMDVTGIRLHGPGDKTLEAQRIEGSSQSYRVADLEPGSYTVTIDDPHFLPWKQEGVQPGKSVPAKLVGAASARLSVVDAATNAPVAHCALRVRFENAAFRPNEFEVFDAKKGLPADGLVAGLIPGDQTLIVLAEGYAPCELHVADLAAGEPRALTAKLVAAKP